MTRADRAAAQPSTYVFPDELRIDELLVRAPVDDDVEAIAPAFVDPAVGGEASMPPLDEQMLRWALQNQIPELKARGVLLAVRHRGHDDGGDSRGSDAPSLRSAARRDRGRLLALRRPRAAAA